MEPWRTELLARLRAENDEVGKAMQAFSRTTEGLMHREPCARCEATCYHFELIAFPCGHLHCMDCAEDLVERQRGYFEKHHPEYVPRYATAQCLVVCSACRQPTSLIPCSDFEAHIARRGRGSRQRYEVDKTATMELRHETYEYFDNQRRSLLGKFLERSLFIFERPSQSDETGRRLVKCVADINQLDRSIVTPPPNVTDGVAMRRIFLDAWSFTKDHNTPQGWRYAFNWPRREADWSFAPSWMSFVRRRRMRRTLVLLPRQCLHCFAVTLRDSERLLAELPHCLLFSGSLGNPQAHNRNASQTDRYTIVSRHHFQGPPSSAIVPSEVMKEMYLMAEEVKRVVAGDAIDEGPRKLQDEDEPHAYLTVRVPPRAPRLSGNRLTQFQSGLATAHETYLTRGFN